MASTTKNAIDNDATVGVAFVVAIEGYDYLITDIEDTAAVVTAWSGSLWSKCLPGLVVDTEREEEINPWSPTIQSGSRVFKVRNLDVYTDGAPGSVDADRFARAVFADGKGNETYLTTTRDPDDSSINATNTGNFSSSGDAYIGVERFSYTTTTTTLFSGSVNRGKYAPFEANTATNWGRHHSLPTVDGTNVQTKLIISDEPRTWIGKHIGLWVHRTVGGVLDTKANAYLLFAGTIGTISDTADQMTVLSCDDIRTAIKDTVLLRDQFVGRVKEGVYLVAPTRFSAESLETTGDNATDLDVVASGASGNNQINAGYYTTDALIEKLNLWLASERAAGRLHSNRWTWSIEPSATGEYRTRLFIDSSTEGSYKFECHSGVLTFLGFDKGFFGYAALRDAGFGGDIWSQEEPFKVMAGQVQESTLTLDYSTGTWFNNRDWLPGEIIDGAPSGENWGMMLMGDGQPLLAQYSSDTSFVEVKALGDWKKLLAAESLTTYGLRYSAPGHLEVRQLVILHGSFEDIMLRLLASTGASGYNHATYDDFPFHLGCAIPWDLLGSGMTDSVSALAESTSRNALSIVLEKPTRFEKAIGAELLLRGAFLTWKNQGIAFVQLPTPNSDVATHTLDETNKAAPEGVIDMQRTVTETTDKWLRNVVVVKFNRSVTDNTYRDSITIRHESSITRYGERKVEINARNTYGHWAGTLNVIESLVSDIGAYLLPLFAEPFKIMHRSIDLSKYLSMYVGDIANVSDNYARDPSDGTRGITGKPALVLSTSYDMGGDKGDGEVDGMTGRVQLWFVPLDNYVVYSPAAFVDDTQTNSGYAADTPTSGKSTLTTYQHKYSLNGDTADADRFAAGDKVLIYSVNEAIGVAPTQWSRTVDSVTSTSVILTSNLSSPAWDSTKYYRITYDDYSTVQSSQQSYAFQADDADGLISDTRVPFLYGYESAKAGAALDLTVLPNRQAIANPIGYGDGVALEAGHMYDLAAMANNLTSYKTAPSAPIIWASPAVPSASTTVWQMFASIPFASMPARTGGAGFTRKLYVAPLAKNPSTGDATIRITLTTTLPRFDAYTDVTFVGRQQSATFAVSGGDVYSTATAVGIPIVASATGIMWLHMESLAGSGGIGQGSPSVFGLGACYLGPLEAS